MNCCSLIALDFDHTICEYNSDVVARKLVAEEKIPPDVWGLYKANGWLTYMNKIFEILHNNSINEEKIKNAIVAIPEVGGMERLLTTMHTMGHEIIIISDSNSLFINWWLQSRNLGHMVSRIFTNPARFNNDGKLNVNEYHTQHSCNMSSVNLCKGKILMDFVDEKRTQNVFYDRIVYIGDGKNDLCPVLRLSQADIACARQDYQLIKYLLTLPHHMSPKATLIIWKDGAHLLKELERAVKNK